MRFSDIKVGTKLVAGFLSVAVIVAVVGVLGIVNLDRGMGTADQLLEVDLIVDGQVSGVARALQGDCRAVAMKAGILSAQYSTFRFGEEAFGSEQPQRKGES